ncbi:uncharacterized protein F5147DRAFT_659079 [Suillus discolor]|uniref:Uncharacterized protein n=1 Tax=Suillus discolor TaxID=1912936 RepID=A0A9P7JLC9_9AGAM|nr:uncharacterized protein F5147DRAFT_659079 [Suillus discolor]KAG2086962.1 hypothetical protein F5147DRAFT_659079 [Suillus discolor]
MSAGCLTLSTLWRRQDTRQEVVEMDGKDRMEAHIHNGEGELRPEEALRLNLSYLDWSYMMDKKHGELLVDVGISFTPRSPDVPIVRVWRLDALEASFGAGGYKYGALEAEMQQERSQQMHIAFRSTYNLYYESIRMNNNQANFASDSDVYKLR